MSTSKLELARYVYLRMKLLSENGICQVSFSDLLNGQIETVPQAIKLVNWLQEHKCIEFVSCVEKVGDGDYLNEYRIGEWRW